MAGCVIITGRAGSAGLHDDVPIPDSFKFDVDSDEPPSSKRGLSSLLAMLQQVVSSDWSNGIPTEYREAMQPYRDMVLSYS